MVLVTHEHDMADYASRIVHVADGRVSSIEEKAAVGATRRQDLRLSRLTPAGVAGYWREIVVRRGLEQWADAAANTAPPPPAP